jgi:excisionase family DNA binding protein
MEKNIDFLASQGAIHTTIETQKALRCSRTFLWKERKAGKIKAIKVGRKVLFSQSSIDAYLKISQEEVSHV